MQIAVVKVILLAFICLVSGTTHAQDARFPLVKGYGGIYEIPEAVEYPSKDRVYRIVVDIKTGADGYKTINPGLINLARLMNLHGLGGVSKENMEVVAVIHGEATISVLSDEAHENRFETENHNTDLIKSLQDAGVKLFICGQSLRARKVNANELVSNVAISLSALTVLTTYQLDGYALISF